jgi:lipoate-protein ligase A
VRQAQRGRTAATRCDCAVLDTHYGSYVAGYRVPCRLLIHGPSPGAWNMAFDEALLEGADSDRVATLRFYEWAVPTLSLGYFQPVADRDQHPASLTCPLVRRSSGGGAILHDRELTYSIAMPVDRQSAANAVRLSLSIHEALVAALSKFAIKATMYNEASLQEPKEPFLCFARRAIGDLIVENRKIAGSAQRRRRGAILQHGSVLLAASDFAPELRGLLELTGQAVSATSLLEVFQTTVRDRLNLIWIGPPDGDAIEQRAATLLAEKFAVATWNLRR